MPSTTLVDTVAGWMGRRSSRRSFLQRVAVFGSAVSVGGLDYVLRPGTAYASICGGGNTCASGWTALCCTVNQGVNQCPPGSFAAGWWKADGAHLCGGKARYYIDCQARCECGCGNGRHFCAQRCWNCQPHCAHQGTCDERRVCSNVFRYGQCNQHVHCTGPVWCRVISCTPPWEWEACSTSSATDNQTRSHSAPCLPHQWTPIQHRYRALGSQGCALGASIGAERAGHHGRVQHYVHGRMYHSDHAGTHFVLGGIADSYAHLGESASELGLPISDTHDNTGHPGRHNLFQHGAIYASGATGVHTVIGPVFTAWDGTGRAAGPLGLPITSTHPTADGTGRHNEFQHGAIYAHPGTGTHVVPAAVLAVWADHRRERGPLGYPTAGLVGIGAGAAHQDFEHGTVDVHPDLGAHGVWGPIFVAWASAYDREQGSLGFPVTDVYAVDADHDRCDFEHGSLVLDKTTGEVSPPPA